MGFIMGVIHKIINFLYLFFFDNSFTFIFYINVYFIYMNLNGLIFPSPKFKMSDAKIFGDELTNSLSAFFF